MDKFAWTAICSQLGKIWLVAYSENNSILCLANRERLGDIYGNKFTIPPPIALQMVEHSELRQDAVLNLISIVLRVGWGLWTRCDGGEILIPFIMKKTCITYSDICVMFMTSDSPRIEITP